MNDLIFIANWKSHKLTKDVHAFLWTLAPLLNKLDLSSKKIIVCPSFTSLEILAQFVRANDLPIAIGAQNVSAFEQGAYTGEVNAEQLKEFCTHVIIGHSERKKYMHETPDDIKQKVEQAKKAGLTVILCVQDENDTVVEGVDMIAFEPPSAIGTGNPESPENIAKVFEKLYDRYPSASLLYGGSVKPDNIKEFLAITHLQGFLIGGASLDPDEFYQLIAQCEEKK